MALACFFLACKVEECPLKLKDVVHAYFVLNRSTAVSETVRPNEYHPKYHLFVNAIHLFTFRTPESSTKTSSYASAYFCRL